MIVDGRDIPESVLAGNEKCSGELQAVQKKKKINLETTGDKKTNALLALLKFQVKANKLNNNNGAILGTCQVQDKAYTLCHQSFMGVGSYKGNKNCGNQMEALYKRIVEGSNGD